MAPRKKTAKVIKLTTKRVERKTVAVNIPADLAEQVTIILASQGADLETLVRLQLGAFCRTRAKMRLCDPMGFGKYHGERVEDIVRTDLRYIVYILGLEGASAKFSTEVLELVESLMNKTAKTVNQAAE
jgi:hypothetical protein